ncbi:UNVERIFIED_CONTAM: hypothetical protein RMT77_010908 [Armadillidium vulgare]
MRKSEKRDPEIIPEPEVELEEPLEHATPKFGRRSKGELNSTHLQGKSPAKSDKEEVSESKISSPKVTPKFGRRSKDEVNNNTLSPAKFDKKEVAECDISSPKELKIKKRKSYDADDTHLDDVNTTANSEFKSPSKKLKFNSKDFLNDCEKLLSLATKQVTPDTIAYSKTLPKLDYSKIAEHFPDKSTEDLKNELLMLIEGTVKIKSLHQLLTEALNDNQTEKPIDNPFNNFVHLNHYKITEEMEKRGPGVNRLAVAAEMWKKLSVSEKRAYRPDIKNVGDKSIGQQPFEIFYELLNKKEDNVKISDARQRFKDLSVKKKVKFIRKSAKKMMKALEELEEHQNSKQEEEEPSKTLKKKVRGPSKEDADLYMKHYGYPDEPSNFLPLFYCDLKKIEIDPKERLISAGKAFYDLNKEKQEQWKKRHGKVKASFDTEVEEWKKNQDKVTLFIWKTFKSPESKVSKKKEALKKDKKPKFKVNAFIKQLTYNDIQVSAPKFGDEPRIPPLKPITLLGIELEKRRGEKFSPAQLKEHFKSLNKTKQMTLRDKCNEMKDKFIKGLKDYVENMSYEKRKLFLGVNRVKYIKVLHQDIFEEDYPHAEYKVYAKPQKVKTPLKSSKKTSGSSQSKNSPNKNESDEEDEEEEEDMEDFEMSESSKVVQPRNYSSRKKKLTSHEENYNENDEDDDDENDDFE